MDKDFRRFNRRFNLAATTVLASLLILSALAVSGSVSIGDRVTVGGGGHRGQPDDSITVDARSGTSRHRSSDVQRVRVQDGSTATIYVGLSEPLPTGSPVYQGMHYHQIHGYRQMLTGIQVTPRISGDGVTLEIDSRRMMVPGRPTGRVSRPGSRPG